MRHCHIPQTRKGNQCRGAVRAASAKTRRDGDGLAQQQPRALLDTRRILKQTRSRQHRVI